MKLFVRLRCWVFFHELKIVQSFSQSERKCWCPRCGRYFAMHDGCRAFLPWDDDLEKFYVDLTGCRTNR